MGVPNMGGMSFPYLPAVEFILLVTLNELDVNIFIMTWWL